MTNASLDDRGLLQGIWYLPAPRSGKWRARFGGTDASDARLLRKVQAENAKLKKLLAEAHLDFEALKVGFAVKR